MARPRRNKGIRVLANDKEVIPKGVGRTTVDQRLLTVDQASMYMGLSSYAMRHRISEGKIPYVRFGKRILLDIHDLDQFIDKNKH